MTNENRNIDEHVGELLSGYVDGELTQQQRQQIDTHCDACSQCRQERDDLFALRKDIGAAQLSQYGEDVWRENMNDTSVIATRGIGWMLFIGGVLAASGVVMYEFIIDSSIALYVKLIAAAVYGGLAALFLSVLRQRLVERKTDKYKDVEI